MIGSGRSSGIVRRFTRGTRLVLQSSDRAFEVKDFPESNAEIQDPNTTNSAPDPSRSDDCLQSLNTRLASSIQQEIVVAPIANSPHPLRPPGQNCKEDADFKA